MTPQILSCHIFEKVGFLWFWDKKNGHDHGARNETGGVPSDPRFEKLTRAHSQFVSQVVIVVESLCHIRPFYDPVDCSPPGSSVHGVVKARILEWVAISFSRGSSQPRNRN